MTSEAVIKRDIRRMLTTRGVYWSNLDASGPGHRRGDPDIVACINGKYVAMEAKTVRGRLSPRQREVSTLIKQAGGIYEVVRCVEDAETIVDTMMES